MTDHTYTPPTPEIAAYLASLEVGETAVLVVPVIGGSLINGSAWFDGPKYDLAQSWVDNGPSPAGNSGPYLKAPRVDEEGHTDGIVDRLYPPYPIGSTVVVERKQTSIGDAMNDPFIGTFTVTHVEAKEATTVTWADLPKMGYSDMADFVRDYPNGDSPLWLTHVTRAER